MSTLRGVHLADGALAVGLFLGLLGVLWAGWHVSERTFTGPTLWYRLLWLVPAMALLLAGFGIVVELRCVLGWIDEDECHVWDQE